MDRPHREAIRYLGEAYQELTESIGEINLAGTVLPSHVSDTNALVTTLTSVKTTLLALITTIQSE
jgi:hypothetical protein